MNTGRIEWKQDACDLNWKEWCAWNDKGECLGVLKLEKVGRHMHWCWYQYKDIRMSPGCLEEVRTAQKELLKHYRENNNLNEKKTRRGEMREQIEKLKEIITMASKLGWIIPQQTPNVLNPIKTDYPLMQLSEVEKCMMAMVDDLEFNKIKVWYEDSIKKDNALRQGKDSEKNV